MASTKAQLAKDKGNEAFKIGDFPTAIGYYTSAILANPNDPTFPLNRAAAYLRLGKYEDAERDCTTTVTLNPSNVKGLFRRAQARMGLNRLADAQTDLKEALRLDPKNDAVKQDLKKVEDLLSKGKPAKAVTATATLSQSTSISPNRRRVPIKIVEPPAGSSIGKTKANSTVSEPRIPTEPVHNDFMKPISSRSLTSADVRSPASPTAHSMSSPPPLAPTPDTFRDAKQARDSTKPSLAGGGIFRSSGDHTIIGYGDKDDVQSSFAARSPLLPPLVNGTRQRTSARGSVSTEPPITLFNFTRAWESLSSAQERWELLSQIPPSTLPSLFQNSLEASHVTSILVNFQTKLNISTDPEDSDRLRMRQYLVSFVKVPRFKTVILLMSKKEKELATEVWERLGVRNGGALWGIN